MARSKARARSKAKPAGKARKAAATAQVSVELAFNKRSYKASDNQKLSFSLTNDSNQPMRILKWHTPLDGIKSDMFHVEKDGKKAVYLGPIYKRGLPTEEDYLTLDPGQTVTEKIDFQETYDIAEVGHYNVRYKAEELQAGHEEPKKLIQKYKAARLASTPMRARPPAKLAVVKSNTAIFKLETSRQAKAESGISKAWIAESARAALAPVAEKTPAFSGCSASQQTTLTKALAEAVKMANAAQSALANAPGWARYTAPRYKEWFGVYDQGRYSSVLTHYQKIYDALANQTVTFKCDCSDAGTYAYVYPTKPYEIHLCGLFWSAPLTGTDSQAGTLIHETSHFNVVAGTDDHVYGQTGCRNLAKTNPSDAIDNADSHEYFAENTPALTMNAAPGGIYKIVPAWRNMPAGFTSGFDAALNGGGPFAGKCYFFKGNKYIRYDWASDKADAGYPLKIADQWKGMPAGFTGSFDAAINGQGPFAGKCYFFKGDKYIRYDWSADKVDPGYPASIATYWKGLPTGFKSNFDAVINGGGPWAGKCYFFKGDSYVRYDWAADKTDPGYPKKIADYWHALPAGFTSNFDAAVEGGKQFSGKGYFFKGDSYVRYNWAGDYAE